MSLRDNLNVLGENKEKYNTFSVPTKKKITKMEKDGNELSYIPIHPTK